MNSKASSRNILRGWTPIIGALSIWFAHFIIVYAAALIWPGQATANVIGIAATVPALIALGVLYVRIRAADVTSEFTEFSKKVGIWATWFTVFGVLFDMAPALFA